MKPLLALLLACVPAAVVGAAECADAIATRRFNPGHYISLNRADSRENFSAVFVPGATGIQVRYRWAELEPERGHYDWSELQADLDAAAKLGAQLVVMIGDKSFNETMPLPAYLAGYALPNRKGGYTAQRWHPEVQQRLRALVAAMGHEFNCNPRFEGVAFQESAPGLEEAVLRASGYSPQAYADALTGMLRAAGGALPNARVFWYMNFLPGGQKRLAEIAAAVADDGVVMGGPDVLPDNLSLVARTYPLYRQLAGRLPLFNSMQHDSYAHPRQLADGTMTYWTLEELLVYARDELHVDYLFWNRKTWRKPPDSWSWDDAVPVIARYPLQGQFRPAGDAPVINITQDRRQNPPD